MFAIDDELAEFMGSGCSIMVATRDAALVPHAVRGAGIRVVAPDRVQVLVPRATGARAIENLRNCGDVAVVLVAPATFRGVQLKGRLAAISDATPEDLALAQEQLRRLTAQVAKHGITRQQARNMWLFDTWRVEVAITSGYVQTPGPGAGAELSR